MNFFEFASGHPVLTVILLLIVSSVPRSIIHVLNQRLRIKLVNQNPLKK